MGRVNPERVVSPAWSRRYNPFRVDDLFPSSVSRGCAARPTALEYNPFGVGPAPPPARTRNRRRILPMRYLVTIPLFLLTIAPALAADEAIFEPGAKLKVESKDGSGGEGPAWHPKLGVLTSGNGHTYQ